MYQIFLNTLWPFRKQHYVNALSWMKIIIYSFKFQWSFFLNSNHPICYVSVWLFAWWHQAITWTSVDLELWFHRASWGHNHEWVEEVHSWKKSPFLCWINGIEETSVCMFIIWLTLWHVKIVKIVDIQPWGPFTNMFYLNISMDKLLHPL